MSVGGCAMGSGSDDEAEWGELAAELHTGADTDTDDELTNTDTDRHIDAQALGVARRTALSHAEFHAEFRHRQPVLLAGLAREWKALSSWSSAEHLASLLDEDVLVLRSPDGRRFLKRDCDQQQRPFADVVRELFVHSPPPPAGVAAAAAAGAPRVPVPEQFLTRT